MFCGCMYGVKEWADGRFVHGRTEGGGHDWVDRGERMRRVLGLFIMYTR